uniref:Uncharacterized protein n=1 Tax=viral metagenome TaxID=1070528 RepID=A0A6C0EX20_9ZZZZ
MTEYDRLKRIINNYIILKKHKLKYLLTNINNPVN